MYIYRYNVLMIKYIWFGITLSIVTIFAADSKDSSAIIGGKIVTGDVDYPYHVSIQQHYINETFHRCDGVLINETWILSSATCVLPVNTALYIKAGSRYHNKLLANPVEQMNKVVKTIVHPQFNLTINELNDIALLQVDKPFDFNSYISAAKLPSVSDAFVKYNLTVTSWGVGNANSDLHIRAPLREVDITVIDNDLCKKHLLSIQRPTSISPSHLCAKPSSSGVSVSSKASGSPLVTRYQYPAYKRILVGIFSRGLLPSANTTSVGFYTNVLFHVDWIQSTINVG